MQGKSLNENKVIDYKIFLQNEFARRIKVNSSYSQRAFALSLGISKSLLSCVLNGSKGLSKTSAIQIAKKLNLSERETETFVNLIEASHSRSKLGKKIAKEKIEKEITELKTTIINNDKFAVISDWYHFAILEMTFLKNPPKSIGEIAKRLGRTNIEITYAIERLQRLNLLEIKNGKFIAKENITFTQDGVPSDAIKKYHSQMLDKCKEALYMQELKERDISSLTVSIDKNDMQAAKDFINEFKQEFMKKFSASNNRDGLYNLSIQFINLEKKENRL